MKKVNLIAVCILCIALLLTACNNKPNQNTSEVLSDKQGNEAMNNTELEFYPEHPSGAKTHKIETTAMPILAQEAPFAVKTLCEEFSADAESFYAKYVDKRFEVTGIAKKVGPDIHNKPSIEISDSVSGQTYALVIFPADDHYSKVRIGDKVVVRANYLVMSNHYGTVMKYSELVSVEKS